MLEKVKSFLKEKNKFLLITFLILIFLILILIVFFLRKEESQDLDSREFETESPTAYYGNYQINVSDEIIDEVDKYSGSYSTFRVDDKSHFEWAQNFVFATKGSKLRYTEKPHPPISGHDFYTIDQTLHYWQDDNDLVTYDNATDLLSFEFGTAVNIQGIQINPQSMESLQNALQQISIRFFSDDFRYQVNNISREGNDYRVKYSRLLDGISIYLDYFETSLLVTPDGRLKEGMFLLAEFTKSSEFFTLSGGEVKENLNLPDYSKFIDFNLLDLSVYDRFGTYAYSTTGSEIGSIDLKTVDFIYNYKSKFQDALMPTFLFEGVGFVEIEGEDFDANFFVTTK